MDGDPHAPVLLRARWLGQAAAGWPGLQPWGFRLRRVVSLRSVQWCPTPTTSSVGWRRGRRGSHSASASSCGGTYGERGISTPRARCWITSRSNCLYSTHTPARPGGWGLAGVPRTDVPSCACRLGQAVTRWTRLWSKPCALVRA